MQGDEGELGPPGKPGSYGVLGLLGESGTKGELGVQGDPVRIIVINDNCLAMFVHGFFLAFFLVRRLSACSIRNL